MRNTARAKQESPKTRIVYLICLLLAAATLVALWGVLGNDFTRSYDDGPYVTKNAVVQRGLTKAGIVWAFARPHAANWHPLTWLSHMLDIQLYGLNPMGHHLTNLLFHIGNVLLLFLLLTRMTGSLWRSAFVAALFGIHPVHVESVAWISERKDVLSTFFWMLTMLAYVGYVRRPKIGRYLPVVLFFILGLLSKPMLVTLPFVLLLLDYWPLKRFWTARSVRLATPSTINHQPSTFYRLILEKTPLFALSAASSAITFIVQQRSGAVAALDRLPVGTRVANAVVSYVRYIGKAIWPDNLSVFYPYGVDAIPMWQIVGAGLLLACVTVLVILFGRRRPYLPVGWLWYLVTLVPVIGLVQVGIQAMADRYTYVPLIGLFIVVAWGVPDLIIPQPDSAKGSNQRTRRKAQPGTVATSTAKVLGSVAVLVILVLIVCTRMQVGYWLDSITLFEHAAACTSRNYLAHHNLGVALARQGRLDEAIAHYRDALRIQPTYADARYNLANALSRQGKLDEAVVNYVEALRLDPKHVQAHSNLASVLVRQGKMEEAVAYYRAAVRLKPKSAKAESKLGSALHRMGRMQEAIAHYQKSLRLNPKLADVHYNLGLAFASQGKFDQAVVQYREALRLNPNHAQARRGLGMILAGH